jgi:hypothetical protein
LEQLLKEKERQKEEATHIEDTQRLVTKEIEMLKKSCIVFSEQKQNKKTRRLESSCIAFLVLLLLLLLLTVEIPLKE